MRLFAIILVILIAILLLGLKTNPPIAGQGSGAGGLGTPPSSAQAREVIACPPAKAQTAPNLPVAAEADPPPVTTALPITAVELQKLDREAGNKLAEMTVVVDQAMSGPEEWARAFAQALDVPKTKFAAGLPLTVLSLGPQLDSPDHFTVQSLTRTGNTIELKIAHTSRRAEGVNLRRNIPWRPLAVVPLPPNMAGKFKLNVTWTALDKVPDGAPLVQVKLRHDELEFEIENKPQ